MTLRDQGPTGARACLRAAVRALLPGLLLALSAPSAVINGVVLENQSGYPMARARVRLSRLEGSQWKSAGTHLSGRTGQFTFGPIPAGYYVLHGVRASYAETAYGQTGAGGAARPFYVDADQPLFLQLRLKRLAAITGRIVDENGVGLPNVAVMAYRAANPMTQAAVATSDDRGVYRITGLSPGRYRVRTGPARLDDGLTLVPTWYPFTTTLVRESRIVRAELDRDTTDVDIQPAPGTLGVVSGTVSGCIGLAKVTLSTDTGRREVSTGCAMGSFLFENLAPGDYEILAEAADGAAFQEFHLDDKRIVTLQTLPLTLVSVRDRANARIQFRRRDPAGPGEVRQMDAEKIPVAPGYWEFSAEPPPGRVLAQMDVQPGYRLESRFADPAWFPVMIRPSWPLSLRPVLSDRGGSLAGQVKLGGEPVAGAPVYLEPVTLAARRSMNGLWTVYTDIHGRYEASSLAAGEYLVLSSFDLAEVNEETLTEARAVTVRLEEGANAVRDLELSQSR